MSGQEAGAAHNGSRKKNTNRMDKASKNAAQAKQPSLVAGGDEKNNPSNTLSPDHHIQTGTETTESNTDAKASNAKASRSIKFISKVYQLIFFPSRSWRIYILKQLPAIGSSLILIVLGFKELPKDVPLFAIFNRFPIVTPLIGSVLLLLCIAAIAISFGPEPEGDPTTLPKKLVGSIQLWRIATIMSLTSFLLSSSLLAIILIHPPWCPSIFCQTSTTMNPRAVHDDNVELSLIDVHHISFMLPGDPTNWSAANPPQNTDAVRIDRPTEQYQIILAVRNLQASRYELLIEKVSLVIDKVDTVPYPLNIWNYGSTVNYTTNPYLATYDGQQAGTTFAAYYVPVPYAHVHLAAYEGDELSVQISSRETAAIRFRIQVTYRFANELKPRPPLLLPNVFNVVFSNAKNWHAYQLQGGEFVAAH